MEQTIALGRNGISSLQENKYQIHAGRSITGTWNGSQGHVSGKIVNTFVNPLNWMFLDIVHMRKVKISTLEYAR